MTRVDFYILGDKAEGDRYHFACRLLEKVAGQRRRIYVHTGSASESQHIDRLLWTFRDQSFIPHGLSGQSEADLNPILIGHADQGGEEHDVLLNLSLQVPSFFSRFERVAEIIDRDPEVRLAGRDRYRFYRDRGYPITDHKIDR